jgi:hypothetical protein
MTMRRWTPLLLPLAALAAACDSSGPDTETRQPGELTILRMAEDAPPLETYDTTFTAVRGEDAELRIRYEAQEGETSGEEFLRFRLDDGSLVNDEDGNPIPVGGSIQIRVRILNPTLLDIEFQPAGLRFNPLEPAELRVRYARADDDFDEDGDVDVDDDRAEQLLSLWRQEQPGDPWVKIGSVVFEEFEDVEGDLFGFTHYAIAF